MQAPNGTRHGMAQRTGALLAPGVLLAAGLWLLISAWPRLSASLAYLPVDTALSKYWSGEPITPAQLGALAARAESVLTVHADPRVHDGAATLRYLEAAAAGHSPGERAMALQDAAAHTRASLASSPLQPSSWLRLAILRDALDDAPERISAALALSVYSGRVEPNLLITRLQWLLAYRHHVAAEDARLLPDQALLTWDSQPRALLQAILDGDIAYAQLADILARHQPAALDAIDEALAPLVR
jgi:hypothetical protein